MLVFKTWCDTCDNECAPAGCTPGAGCRLLQRVPGVTHHSPPPVSGPRSPDLIGARARVAAAPHPAPSHRLEAINCCLIGSVSLSNSCVPVNALQNLSSPPMMHVHLPIWVVQRSPLSGPTIINLNMSHPSQVFSSCQFFCPRPASSRHWSIRASLPPWLHHPRCAPWCHRCTDWVQMSAIPRGGGRPDYARSRSPPLADMQTVSAPGAAASTHSYNSQRKIMQPTIFY